MNKSTQELFDVQLLSTATCNMEMNNFVLRLRFSGKVRNDQSIVRLMLFNNKHTPTHSMLLISVQDHESEIAPGPRPSTCTGQPVYVRTSKEIVSKICFFLP